MHFLLEIWHPQIANIKISSVESTIVCDFPWMNFNGAASATSLQCCVGDGYLMNAQINGLS